MKSVFCSQYKFPVCISEFEIMTKLGECYGIAILRMHFLNLNELHVQ